MRYQVDVFTSSCRPLEEWPKLSGDIHLQLIEKEAMLTMYVGHGPELDPQRVSHDPHQNHIRLVLTKRSADHGFTVVAFNRT